MNQKEDSALANKSLQMDAPAYAISSPLMGEGQEGGDKKLICQSNSRRKKIRNAIISIVIGSIIVWFLLSKIDPRGIPRAMGNISLWSLAVAFLLYAVAVYLKAVRFKIILRTGISLRQLFPIVSLYMFFANILPMRAGELSYIYLLKRQAKTPGTKSFASLIIGGISDAAVILIAMFVVGWYLRDALTEGISYFLLALAQKANFPLLAAAIVLLMGGVIAFVLLKRRVIKFSIFDFRFSIRSKNRKSQIKNLKSKITEVRRELANTSFDLRLIGIIACSILIIVFRFGTQWYLVRSMGIAIDIWKLSFALLFGVLFSLIPIHGPAGFGTVEAPWVLSLSVLNVPEKDAITSGFGLHIIIIIYCIIIGLYGAAALSNFRFLNFDFRFKPKTKNQKSKINLQ